MSFCACLWCTLALGLVTKVSGVPSSMLDLWFLPNLPNIVRVNQLKGHTSLAESWTPLGKC